MKLNCTENYIIILIARRVQVLDEPATRPVNEYIVIIIYILKMHIIIITGKARERKMKKRGGEKGKAEGGPGRGAKP